MVRLAFSRCSRLFYFLSTKFSKNARARASRERKKVLVAGRPVGSLTDPESNWRRATATRVPPRCRERDGQNQRRCQLTSPKSLTTPECQLTSPKSLTAPSDGSGRRPRLSGPSLCPGVPGPRIEQEATAVAPYPKQKEIRQEATPSPPAQSKKK